MTAAASAYVDGPTAMLKISDTMELPLDALTQTFAFIGKRGTGKTNGGVVLTEEFIRAGLPVCVIDPVGVWFGLRAAGDGKGQGLPVVIFGGEHADIPIEPVVWMSAFSLSLSLLESRFTAPPPVLLTVVPLSSVSSPPEAVKVTALPAETLL